MFPCFFNVTKTEIRVKVTRPTAETPIKAAAGTAVFFCRGQIRLKFVEPSACRTLADFLSRLTALRLEAESSKIKMAPTPLT